MIEPAEFLTLICESLPASSPMLMLVALAAVMVPSMSPPVTGAPLTCLLVVTLSEPSVASVAIRPPGRTLPAMVMLVMPMPP